MRRLDDIADSLGMSLRKFRNNREACCAVVHGVTESQTPLGN